MEKKLMRNRRRSRGRVVVAAAFCGVFFVGGLDDGALRSVSAVGLRGVGETDGTGKIKRMGGVKETPKIKESGRNAWGNDWFGGDRGILATPASGTRLNVRELRPGDILAARWEEEKRNETPGFWNHLAIVGTDGKNVVEAQKSADGIVTAPINCFLARYSDVRVFRFFCSVTARRAAEFAETRVALETILTPPLRSEGEKGRGEIGESEGNKGKRSGPRYSWSASLAPRLQEDAPTENCVSLVRRAFWRATGVDYRWKTPDDLARWDKSGDFAEIGRL